MVEMEPDYPICAFPLTRALRMWKLLDTDMRNICKERLEALEHWLRRFIDETLTSAYGDFFSHVDANGDRLIKKDITASLEERMRKEPERYSRKVDAILIDTAIDIICNPRLYSKHFKDALLLAFPEGECEARTFMKRLVEPRNRLAHANPISVRQFEQIICYTGDIIESLKEFYRNNNLSQEYDVPRIFKLIDSFGRAYYRAQCQPVHDGGIMVNLTKNEKYHLRVGDKLTLEVEVDANFSDDEYEISWASIPRCAAIANGKKAIIDITEQQVAGHFAVQCRVTTNKGWHAMSMGADDFLMYIVKVLPPI